MPTARSVLSANLATPVLFVRVACGGGVLPKHSWPSLTVPWYPCSHVSVSYDQSWADASLTYSGTYWQQETTTGPCGQLQYSAKAL